MIGYKVQEIFRDGVLKDDEHETLERAVKGARALGFTEVTLILCLRNGYIYRVKAMLDNLNTERNGKNDNHETLERAVKGARALGFAEVAFTLCLRTGYVSKVKAMLDNLNTERNGKNENHN